MVCFRFLLTWIREMNIVEGWKRYMNNCIQPTANSLVLVNPNAPVITRTASVFKFQKIWRQVCFHPMVGISLFYMK